MRLENGALRLSASDLMRFTGCPHATAFDVDYAYGRGPLPGGDDAESKIVQKKGHEHEARILQEMRASGVRIAELPVGGDIATQAADLREVLRDGPDIVYQAPLSGSFGGAHLWGGRSDFLHKVDRPSDLGSFSYEVSDTKLKREVVPAHVLQLTVYSDLLTEVQGVAPIQARVVLGTGTIESLRLDDYGAYARRLRGRLESFVEDPWPTRATPCAECAICRWAARCEDDWRTVDSLFGVANITRSQVMKLEAAGITTLAQLSAHEGRIPGLANPSLEKVVRQARLQQARKTGEPHFELCELQASRGFALLPEPDPDDIFYDIEGDPHHPDGGLEYLHGLRHRGAFTAFWAHDREAEAESLRQLFAYFEERLAGRPGAHIYHYAPYEVTTLRRLVNRHRVGEVFFDQLLRERRFVDLFTVVRGALVASEENYSIKSLERLYYGGGRTGDVTTSMGSVVAYHEWLDTGVQKVLDDIEAYNAIDCDSTEKLRNWLVEVRPANMPWPQLQGDTEKSEATSRERQAEIEEVQRLVASVPEPERRQALFDIGMFHRREDKPAWWAVFDSIAKDGEDLLDDLDALGGLVAAAPAELAPTRRSLDRRYTFPPQETKLRNGSKVTIAVDGDPKSLTVVSIDRKAGEIVLRAGKDKEHWLADHLSLHPDTPFDNKGIRAALRSVLADQANGRELSAVDDLLSRRQPRLTTGEHDDILAGRDPVEGMIAAVLALDGSTLPVQGPPGTGKTYVSARAILALVERGLRVGVCAHSHEAIRNLLEGCVDAARGGSTVPTVAHRGSDESLYEPTMPVQWVTDPKGAVLGQAEIVGGTAWHFSRDDQVGAFHALFVDEAGQMSLANLLSMGRAAHNIVLVGDPRQLPQVIQGAHPGAAGLSCLEYLLDGQATIPTDQGIFLSVSRRMHPEVCAFVSDRSYEGRLASHPDTARQAIAGTPWPAFGAHWVPVSHDGRSQSSPEEVSAIVQAAQDLLGGLWSDRDGVTRQMSAEDVIVVAPYNAQVNDLRDALDAAGLAAVKVGTVDRFQGQEAAACLVSMTASSTEESPRGMEFLLSLNRINVAVSRAKALALVFGSERLLDAACRTLEQMRLANTLCALAEVSTLERGEGLRSAS